MIKRTISSLNLHHGIEIEGKFADRESNFKYVLFPKYLYRQLLAGCVRRFFSSKRNMAYGYRWMDFSMFGAQREDPMDQSLIDMKTKWIRTTLTGILVGLSFCTLVSQTYCNKATVVGANRVRVEVCQLDLRPDSTYLWVFTNYTSSILGRVKECNRMRSDTTIGSYSLSGDVIQFFQELPEVDTFALCKVSNRRIEPVGHDRNRRGFSLTSCR